MAFPIPKVFQPAVSRLRAFLGDGAARLPEVPDYENPLPDGWRGVDFPPVVRALLNADKFPRVSAQRSEWAYARALTESGFFHGVPFTATPGGERKALADILLDAKGLDDYAAVIRATASSVKDKEMGDNRARTLSAALGWAFEKAGLGEEWQNKISPSPEVSAARKSASRVLRQRRRGMVAAGDARENAKSALSAAQVKGLLAAVDCGDALLDAKMRAMFALSFDFALRINECRNLRVDDILWEGTGKRRFAVRLRGSKRAMGAQVREAKLAGESVKLLAAYLRLRSKAGIDSPWLFPAERQVRGGGFRPISEGGMGLRFHAAARACRATAAGAARGEFGWHSFRKGRYLHLAEHGLSEQAINELLGWKLGSTAAARIYAKGAARGVKVPQL